MSKPRLLILPISMALGSMATLAISHQLMLRAA
jgi:hypothetical protein